ncbi:MAG TPA: hypothetical protein VHZ64_00515 [Xanthobacteraceae bacterium]|nr:hypothetical protein [Xanthobacteraceae bacterium]
MLQLHRTGKQTSTPEIVVFRDADVVESGIGESPAAVADRTIGRAVEQRESTLGGGTDRRFVAANPAVEWRVTRHDRAFERGQRLLDLFSRYAAIGERGIKSRDITG